MSKALTCQVMGLCHVLEGVPPVLLMPDFLIRCFDIFVREGVIAHTPMA